MAREEDDSVRIRFILSTLRESNLSEGFEGLYLLSGLSPQQVPIFEQGLAEFSDVQKELLISGLADLAEADPLLDFGAIFDALLQHPLPKVRQAAINGLMEMEDIDEELAGPLVHILQTDADTGVRAVAAIALGHILYLVETEDVSQVVGMAVENALLGVWSDDQEPLLVRRRALESLAFLGERVAMLIESAYFHPDLDMRVSSIFAMGRSLLSRWNRYVFQELESDEPKMRYEAAAAAGELQLEEAIPLLERLAAEEDISIAGAAIWALGEMGTMSALEALKRLAMKPRLNEILSDEISDAIESINFWLPFLGELDEIEDDSFFYDFGEGDSLGETPDDTLSPL